MRRLWTAAAIIAIMLGASLINGRYALQLTDRMGEQLARAQSFADQERWGEAERLTRQAYEDWQNHHFYFHTTMRHGDTDEVLRAFRAVLEYLELREADQYNAANADLMAQLELLAEMEQPSVVNVL